LFVQFCSANNLAWRLHNSAERGGSNESINGLRGQPARSVVERTRPARYVSVIDPVRPLARIEKMKIRDHKTKIVATIGPASESAEMLERLILAGLDIARLNFSHGEFEKHGEVIARIREAARKVGRNVAIMADLPGPKMRVGKIDPEPIYLQAGDDFSLTTNDFVGDSRRAAVSFEPLPRVVKPGDRVFLNDGLVQLQVMRTDGKDACCRVVVGGELRSRKGLNLPGIKLGISAFTEHDRACLEFALRHGVDAVSQSFVDSPEDIETVRAAALSFGKRPLIIAKIERAAALENYDKILEAADGIMIARGDLGVEVPIQEIAVLQKQLIIKACIAGKPVITATQMLESMVASPVPTRAESTDVANAILDGTDCVMLSGESAMGRYPEEAVTMLGKIADATEPHRPPPWLQYVLGQTQKPSNVAQAMAVVVERALETTPCAAVFIPTSSGGTARMISRFKPAIWIVAVTSDEAVARALQFSYGVKPVYTTEEPEDWREFASGWLKEQGTSGDMALLVAAASSRQPDANHRIEVLRVPEKI
jgi:pyruvate kinase